MDWRRCLHVGGTTTSALDRIMRLAGKKYKLRQFLRRENQVLFKQCVLEDKLELKTGGEFTWEHANYSLLLPQLVAASTELQEVFSMAAREHPCSEEEPWRLVVAMDEYSPGDKHKPKNLRKCMVVSINIMELGFVALSHDLTWCTCAVLRNTIIQKTRGGWSRCFRCVLHSLLTSPLSVRRAGIALSLHGEPFMLFAKLEIILTDLDGHRLNLDWTGAGGTRPCFGCANVWRKNYPVIPGQVTICEHDVTKFQPMTTSLLFDMLDVLEGAYHQWQSGEITKAQYADMEQAFGYHYNPDGVLFDEELRAEIDWMKVLRVDAMHCELQHGVFAVECSQFIHACRRIGITHDFWAHLMQSSWQFPRHHAMKIGCLKDIFSKQATDYADRTKRLKCKAGEYIAMYSLIRHFVETQLQDVRELDLERNSFECACECIDLYLEAKRAPLDKLDEVCTDMTAAQKDHLQAHQLSYGTQFVIPKHHNRGHLPPQIRYDRGVMDMWVVERMNLRVKRIGEPVQNTRMYEHSVLASLLTKQHNELQDAPDLLPTLVGKSADGESPGVRIASGAKGFGVNVTKGDVVFNLGIAGVVQGCAAETGRFYVVCNVMQLHGPRWPSSATYRLTCERRLWPLQQVREATAWYGVGHDQYVVLR